MLQIDHVYEFLYQELFKDFDLWHSLDGVINPDVVLINNIHIFTLGNATTKKIYFYDQEPLLNQISDRYFDIFNFPSQYTLSELESITRSKNLPHNIQNITDEQLNFYLNNLDSLYKKKIIVTSEISPLFDHYSAKYNSSKLYYFFHGFAALDWYRGHYALNYNKTLKTNYQYDFISYNRIINHDRSYRIYFVSRLKELGLLEYGLVSFGVTNNVINNWRDEVSDPNTKLSETACRHAEKHLVDITKLVIDSPELPGSASADIPRGTDSLWHVVTETVFYYNKLHLTEKIFKPIVSKQPFMLLAAPGNLEYLRSYGFKTFDGIIDESYDKIQDNDTRVDAVVEQLHWYCNLSPEEKSRVIERLAPIVDYNFQHFYGEFKHIIARELLDNTKAVFKEIGYDDSTIAYENTYKVLTN